MIERRYTGIAKQGADVVANPTLDGSEQALNSIQINGENFKIAGGGSGKLKLVATATQDEHNPKYFHPNKQLEYGKLYYIVYEDDFVGFSSSTLMLIKDYIKEGLSISNDSTLLATDEEESTKFAKITYNFDNNLFEFWFIDDETLDVLEGNNAIKLQIYEVEFGSSSGGIEKEQYRLENVQLICEGGQIKIDVPTLKKNKIYHFHMNTSMGYVANFNFYIDEFGTSLENIGFYYDIDQNTTICNLYYEENNYNTNKPAIIINAYEDVELLEETADYIIISEV